MLLYQIRKYWLKAMYAQKTLKLNISLPMSWKCSVVTTPSSFRLERIHASSAVVVATAAKFAPAKK